MSFTGSFTLDASSTRPQLTLTFADDATADAARTALLGKLGFAGDLLVVTAGDLTSKALSTNVTPKETW